MADAVEPCCPSCSAAAPAGSLSCGACGWDFTVAPPLGGFAVPPARAPQAPDTKKVAAPVVAPVPETPAAAPVPDAPVVASDPQTPDTKQDDDALVQFDRLDPLDPVVPLVADTPAAPIASIAPVVPIVANLSPEAPAEEPTLLPTSREDVRRSAPAAEPPAEKPLNAKTAAAVGAGLGAVCVIALYLTMASSGNKTPPPVAAPAAPSPPAAVPEAPPPPPDEPPDEPAAAAPVPAPKERRWIFTGTVYDLSTAKGVFGAGLIFVDRTGEEVGATESDEEGRYRVTLPAGPPQGYGIRIMHEDYGDKHIVEMNEGSSLRKAGLGQRELLMISKVKSSPWIGNVEHRTRRDIGLVPLSWEKQP